MINHWRICFILGLAVIAVSIFIFPAFPQEMAYKSTTTPVYAFEFATSQEDLIAVFGEAGDPERPARIAAMDAGNHIDFGYMLFYSLFIASFFVAVRSQKGGNMWLVFATLGLAAGLSDLIENMILLQITENIEVASGLSYLFIPVHIKFALLYFCALGTGYYFVRAESKPSKTFGGILSLMSILALIQLFVSGGEEGTVALVVAWFAQLIVSAMRLKKPTSTVA